MGHNISLPNILHMISHLLLHYPYTHLHLVYGNFVHLNFFVYLFLVFQYII